MIISLLKTKYRNRTEIIASVLEAVKGDGINKIRICLLLTWFI